MKWSLWKPNSSQICCYYSCTSSIKSNEYFYKYLLEISERIWKYFKVEYVWVSTEIFLFRLISMWFRRGKTLINTPNLLVKYSRKYKIACGFFKRTKKWFDYIIIQIVLSILSLHHDQRKLVVSAFIVKWILAQYVLNFIIYSSYSPPNAETRINNYDPYEHRQPKRPLSWVL